MGKPLLTTILLLGFLSVLDITAVNACPTQCICSGTEVDCSDKGLTEIPTDIPINTTHLYLDGNSLVSISNHSFSTLTQLKVLNLGRNIIEELDLLAFSGLQNIERLHMKSNELTALPADVFIELTKLLLLTLNDNKISCLQKRSFQGLRWLQVLHLHRNKVKFLPEGIFRTTSVVKEIYLHDNSLEMLSNDVFNGLGRLQNLYLYDNLLTTLPRGVFDGLINIKNLFLYNNPWSCDCRLKNSRQWFDENEGTINLGSSRMICEAPEQHKGEDILTIPYANLTCHPPPVMDEPYKVITALIGSFVMLDCNVTGTPIPTNYWITPNRTIANRDMNQTIANGDMNQTIYCHEPWPLQIDDGSLVLENATLEDEGPYTCIAKNIEGTTQATRILKVELEPTAMTSTSAISRTFPPIKISSIDRNRNTPPITITSTDENRKTQPTTISTTNPITTDTSTPPFTLESTIALVTEVENVASDDKLIALYVCLSFIGGVVAFSACFGIFMLCRHLYYKKHVSQSKTKHHSPEQSVSFDNTAYTVDTQSITTEGMTGDPIYSELKTHGVKQPLSVPVLPDRNKPSTNAGYDVDN